VAAPTEDSDSADASFWSWNPDDDAEEMRFAIDEEPSAGAAAAAPAGPDNSGDPGTPVISAASVTREEPPAAEEPAYEEEPAPRVEGIGHRLGALDHIFGHTRMGMWRRRLVIAVVIGAVVSFLVSWQIGVTLGVIFAIADTVFRSRTPIVTAPLPGVKLTRAQKQTQHQLNSLEKSGYKALHSRLIPDSEDHIDHLVIGPAGVFSIDSEYWDKHLPIRTKNARQLWHGPFSMKDRLEHARWEAEQASELLTRSANPQLLSRLPGGKVTVRPAMAVYGPKIPWDVATIRDVDVFKGGRLRTYLRRYARQNDARPLDATEIEQLHTAAHRALPHLNPGVLAPQPA
jgi:nuclease-like protein